MKENFITLQKYNFWTDGCQFDVGFERSFYLDKIINVLDNRLIKVLIGQRRTGKSYVLRQIINHLIRSGVKRENIFYLNKEQFEFDSIQNADDLNNLFEYYKKELQVQGKIYIFLDEIQDIADWEKIVVSWSQDQKTQYELFITGSNSNMLSSELGTLLGGRYLPIYIYPFSYSEYIEYLNLEKGKESLIKYLRHGGLPEILNLKGDETVFHYLSALKDSIILNDIVKKYNVRDISLLERIFIFLAANPAMMFSFKKITNYLMSSGIKTNYETVSNYVSYLQKAILIHECERYDIRGKSILTGERKFYLNDLSFKKYFSSGFDPGLSHGLENIIYLHFKRLGYQIYVGTVYKSEVDFVLEKNGYREYWQVSYLLADESIVEREYRSLKKIQDNYPKTVLSMDEILLQNSDGIEHKHIWDILAT